MFITLTLVIGTAIGLGTGLLGGGALGYAVAIRRREEREADEDYERMVNYYSQPNSQPNSPEQQYNTEARSVFSRL